MVFYQRKGKTYIRSLPVRHHKNDSPAQILNRQRFGAMLSFAKQFKTVVIPQIWNQASRSLNGNQLFIKTNKGAFDAQGNIPEPRLVQLSIGKLHLPEEIKVIPQEDPLRMGVSWYPDATGGDRAYWDELMVISYGEGQFSDLKTTDIHRGENTGVFELPPLSTSISHLYLFFGSMDKRNYSESICFEIHAN